MIELTLNGKDMTAVMSDAVWSGDENQAARCLSFCIPLELKAMADTGDRVSATFDGKEIFSGIVLYREADAKRRCVKVRAYDYGIYLVKSKAFKTYSGSPDAIARAICSEAGIGAGSIKKVSQKKKCVCTGNKTYLTVLREVYGSTPRIFVSGGRLNVKNPEVVASISSDTIENAQYIRSAEKMVNRVVAVRGKRILGEVQNSTDRMRYGTFSDRYTYYRGHEYAPKSKLSGLSETVVLRGIGNMACVAGEYVTIKESYTGAGGTYCILEDKHYFVSPQAHIMELELKRV